VGSEALCLSPKGVFAIVVTEQHDIFLWVEGTVCVMCNATFQKNLALDTQEMGSRHQLISKSLLWTNLSA